MGCTAQQCHQDGGLEGFLIFPVHAGTVLELLKAVCGQLTVSPECSFQQLLQSFSLSVLCMDVYYRRSTSPQNRQPDWAVTHGTKSANSWWTGLWEALNTAFPSQWLPGCGCTAATGERLLAPGPLERMETRAKGQALCLLFPLKFSYFTWKKNPEFQAFN